MDILSIRMLIHVNTHGTDIHQVYLVIYMLRIIYRSTLCSVQRSCTDHANNFSSFCHEINFNCSLISSLELCAQVFVKFIFVCVDMYTIYYICVYVETLVTEASRKYKRLIFHRAPYALFNLHL